MSFPSKRAITLAAAFVSSVTLASAQTTQPAPEKSQVDEIKQPVDWFKWGADLRLRQEFHENAFTLDHTSVGDIFDYQRYRARVWGSILPTDQLSLNARLTWEGRYYWEPASREGFDDDYIIPDQLNLTVKNIANTKSTLTVGRQDIVLLDGWLVLDGTPLDGSRTIFFDAVRYQYEIPNSKFSLDMAVLQTHSSADEWLPVIMNDDAYKAPGEATLSEQDETGAFVDVRYKPEKTTQYDAYYIYKHSYDPKSARNGEQGYVHAIGGRAEHGFTDNIVGRVEGVYEFGTMHNGFTPSQGDLSAYGATGRLSYLCKDQWDTRVHFTGEYLSGDDPDTSDNEAFTSMWGRWPQFSELYILTYAPETRVADVTNLIRVGPSLDTSPTSRLSFNAAYYALFAADQTTPNAGIIGDGYFRGHLFTGVAKYKFNRYMSGHLWGEYFIPGDYYASNRDDNAIFLRAELMFTF